MVTVRRLYVFLVCAVSLQSVTWAFITLLRNLILHHGDLPIDATALQAAIIMVGVPLFLVHWIWAQRSAKGDAEERESALRRAYLYSMLAGFLGPFIAMTVSIVGQGLRLAFGQADLGPATNESLLNNIIAMAVLAVVWFYHHRIVSSDSKAAPETGNAATVRRLYLLGFSTVGLTMVTFTMIRVLRWVIFRFDDGTAIVGPDVDTLIGHVALLTVGLTLWILFWRRAQGLFSGPNKEEQYSALRKAYLYTTVFIGVIGTVVSTTFIVNGFLRHLLGLSSGGDIRDPLSVILVMGLLWAYHAYVLHNDTKLAGRAPRQAAVRRIYLYLVAGVGLAALLVGVGGDISVVIRSVSGGSFGEALKAQLAGFTAAIIAGMPVWLYPWWKAQVGAAAKTLMGTEERRSVTRKIYLYSYLFVATMTVLGSAIYILARLLSLFLGQHDMDNLSTELGHAIAFALMGIGVWLYHGYTLRRDGQRKHDEEESRRANLRVAVVDVGDGQFGNTVVNRLRGQLPGVAVDPIGLTPTAVATMKTSPDMIHQRLAAADIIAGPWCIAVAGGAEGAVTDDIAAAVTGSPARKLLTPVWSEGWDWAGVDRRGRHESALQTVRAVKQMAAGEEIKASGHMGPGVAAAIIIGGVIMLVLLSFAYRLVGFLL